MLARRRFGSQLQRRRLPSHRLRTRMRSLLGNLQGPQQRPRELVRLRIPHSRQFMNGPGNRAHAQTSSRYSGRLGNVCQFPGGTGTCSRGVCTLTSCGTGYYLSAGKCVQYNLQTDVNNWHVLLIFPSATLRAFTDSRSVAEVSGESAPFRTGWQPAAVVSVPSLLAPPATLKAARRAWPSTPLPTRGTGETFPLRTPLRERSAALILFAGKSGRLGNVCSFSNGAGTCTGGVCTYTSCSRSGSMSSGANASGLTSRPTHKTGP